jgi:glycosyltransferase involved in cell wall biosynthesis
MKILLIQPWIRLGGAESLSIYLAYYLEKLGYETKIATLYTDFKETPQEAKCLRYITPHKLFAKLCEKNLLFRILFGVPLLWILLWRHIKYFDIINPHNFPSYWLTGFFFTKKPIIWFCNEPPMSISWKIARKTDVREYFIAKISDSWLDKWIVRYNINNIIVLDTFNQRRVMQRYGRKSIIINAGVNVNFFKNGYTENIVTRYKLRNNFILLTVGRLVPQKNQIVSIYALKIVIKYIPNAKLIIVGSGTLEKYLKSEVQRLNLNKHVIFIGFVSNEDLRDLYHICDINIYSAVNQSWGLTPFEALAAGKISIVSSDCGASEVINKINIGIISKPTPKEFAENIMRFYYKRSYYQSIAKKGFQYVKNNMSWQQFAKKVFSVFLQTKNIDNKFD